MYLVATLDASGGAYVPCSYSECLWWSLCTLQLLSMALVEFMYLAVTLDASIGV